MVEPSTKQKVDISSELIERVRKKLNASPEVPYVWIVDQGLRNYLEK